MSETASNDLPAEVKVENKIPAEESPPKKEEPQPAESPAQSPAPTQIKEEKENKTPKESPEPKANGEPGAAIKIPTLREQFRAFSKFGDTKSDGKHLTLSQSDKWMKQAKVIDGKTITTTDTAIHFKKFKQMKILYQDYEKYLADLAKAKSVEVSVLKNKLRSCGLPGTTGTTAVVKSQAVDRLTDSKKYTGSHKMRVESPPKGKVSPSPKK